MEYILSVLLTILGAIVTVGIKGMLSILKEIRDEIKELKETLIKHDGQLVSLTETVKDHEERIRKIESK